MIVFAIREGRDIKKTNSKIYKQLYLSFINTLLILSCLSTNQLLSQTISDSYSVSFTIDNSIIDTVELNKFDIEITQRKISKKYINLDILITETQDTNSHNDIFFSSIAGIKFDLTYKKKDHSLICLLYTSPSPRD